MPEELTDAQVEELGERLRALEVELRGALEAGSDGAKVVSLDQPIGRVSRIDALQQQKMAEASKQKQQIRLGQVKVALGALAQGDYGYCRECEEPIGYKRLNARPETPFCLQCQGGRERG